MKKKIQEALEQAYAVKLGLTDKKVYARVAGLGETYVAKDEDIPAFVEKAEDLLKGFQAYEDQGRTLAMANAKNVELEEELKKLRNKGGEGEPGGEGKKQPEIDWQATLAETVKKAVEPLAQELAALKSSSSAKEALTNAKTSFFGGDYAKKYKTQADDAWERAVELNEATGSKMTADELVAKATGYFNKSVSRLGVDTSKPFQADSDAEDKDGTLDWSAEKKRLQDEGRLPKDAK